jgi:cytochrome c oxidase cbb3-type subunit 4
MDIGIVRGIITVVVLLLFLGILAWSWSRNRNTEFDAASRLPLENDDRPPGNGEPKEHQS